MEKKNENVEGYNTIEKCHLLKAKKRYFCHF